MSSFNNGVLPCPFGECGGVCEGVVVEEYDGEDEGEEKGGGRGVFSPFIPFPFGGLSSFPQFHFGGFELSPCSLEFLSS